jgi:hypothetical protein
MKKKFYDERRKKSYDKPPGPPSSSANFDNMPKDGKWCKPTDAERAGKTYKRVVDGKPYYIDRRTNRWKPDRLTGDRPPSAHPAGLSVTTQSSAGGVPAAAGVSPLSSATPSTQSGLVTVAQTDQRVAIANAQRLMTQAFTTLTASFE